MLAKLTKVELVKEIRFLRSQLAVQHHRIDNLEQVKAHAYKEASRLSDALLCVSDRIDTARGVCDCLAARVAASWCSPCSGCSPGTYVSS